MCSSAPKVKPVASAPYVGPEVIDEAAVMERDRSRARNRARGGRQATILTEPGAGMPTAPVKTALGS